MSETPEYTVTFDESPEGGFTARCAEVPGAISEGRTKEEARENLMDAIAMILGVRRDAPAPAEPDFREP